MRGRPVRCAAASVLLALAAVYAGAWLTTERFGASRAVAWLEADTGDIDRFPSRPVPPGGPVLELPVGAPLDLAQLWGLADPVALLEQTDTAALLVVQHGEVRHEWYAWPCQGGVQRSSQHLSKILGLRCGRKRPSRGRAAGGAA